MMNYYSYPFVSYDRNWQNMTTGNMQPTEPMAPEAIMPDMMAPAVPIGPMTQNMPFCPCQDMYMMPIQQMPNVPMMPIQQMPNAPMMPIQQMPNAPIMPIQQMPNAPMMPIQQMPNAPMMPIQQMPNAPVMPIQQTPNAPVMPIQQTPNAPIMPTQQTPKAPVMPIQQTPNAPIMPTQQTPKAPVMPITGNMKDTGPIAELDDVEVEPNVQRPDARPPLLSNNPPLTNITLFKELTAYSNYGNPSGNADMLYTDTRGTWTFEVPQSWFSGSANQRAQIIIRGVLDDHYSVATNKYSCKITVNGVIVHEGRVPLEHGVPAGGKFTNWKSLTFNMPNLRRNNRVVILNTSSTGKNDWIGFDWMELRIINR